MTTATIETRHTAGTVTLRSGPDGQPRMGGYALKFGPLSQNLGGFVERVAPGAVTKTIKDGGDVLARYQHLDEYLLGRTLAETLRLTIDDVGLEWEVDLPDTSYARDLAVLASRGDVQHSSFAFRTLRDEWGYTEQGFPLRTLLEISLVDVAPVVSPAYLDTTSGLRALADARGVLVEQVITAAAENRLSDIITPETPAVTEPGATHSTALRSRRAELIRRRSVT